MRGTITFISADETYGFIRLDADDHAQRLADAFFSVPACWGPARVGKRVTCDLLNEAKPRACNVRVLK